MRQLWHPGCGTGRVGLPSLIVAVLLALAGCATPEPPPEEAPPPQVSESVWPKVDSDIGAASVAAKGQAGNYARGAMGSWRDRIRQRNETDFIPWFTSYWTQQWLTVKMAWYRLSSEEGKESAVKRLAAYLQEQYRDRVLNPVAREVDPDQVREQATKRYVQSLREQLQGIPPRYGLPQDQFDRRLKDIPAIALAPPPARSATLYQLVRTDPVARLPAYAALIAQGHGAGSGPIDARISPMTKQTSEKLMSKLAASGGAGAAAMMFGGIAGMIISLGTAGYDAIAHENQRPRMETQLRESLDAGLDEMWRGLMEDPANGVMAGVHYLSGQIESGLAHPVQAAAHEAALLPVAPPILQPAVQVRELDR